MQISFVVSIKHLVDSVSSSVVEQFVFVKTKVASKEDAIPTLSIFFSFILVVLVKSRGCLAKIR